MSLDGAVGDKLARRGFRPDIEGLRGIAVLAVVFFHLRLGVVSGGYVGVDVFFVISGFLITGQLRADVEQGNAHLPTFWAKRLRRLAPLLFLTIAGTLIAALMVYSPLEWRRMADDAGAATVYLSNIAFARDGTEYFQTAESPFLHLWSLGAEEQFYLFWPVLIAATAGFARRTGSRVRSTLTAVIGLTTAASFAAALVLTSRRTPWSFFSPVTRAWEFGLGALVAVVGVGYRLPQRWSALVGWLGGLAILGASVWFDELTPTPGWSTLLPTLGTVALLLQPSGSGQFEFARWMSASPLRLMGRASYAWYLLHWPAIVLAEAAFLRPGEWVRWVAACATLIGAVVVTRWVETPLRHHDGLGRPRVAYPAVLVASMALLASCFGVARWADHQMDDQYLAHLAAVREARGTGGSGDCQRLEVAPGLVECVYGDPAAESTVMLVGDSHAAQWAPAAEVAAAQLHLRLVIRTRGGCPAVEVFVRSTGFDRASGACLEFRQRTNELIAAVRPAAVLIGSADFTSRLLDAPDGALLSRDRATAHFEAALAEFVSSVRGHAGGIGLVLDNPRQPTDPIECPARGRSVEDCSISVEQAHRSSGDFLDALRRVAETEALAVLDAFDLLCDDTLCPVAKGDLIVYADADHLSFEFAVEHAAVFGAFVTQVLRSG